MQTERQIKLDYNRTKKYASELEEEATRLTKIANNEFGGVLDELRTVWKGDNAEKYVRKGEQLKSDITKTAKSLKSIASVMRSNAQTIYQAEMENLRIAQERQRAAEEAAAAYGDGYSSGGGGGGAFGGGEFGSR